MIYRTQEELELACKQEAERKFLKMLEEGITDGDTSNMPGFQAALAESMGPLMDSIDKHRKRRGGGILNDYAKRLSTGQLAFLTLRYALNGMILRSDYATVKNNLGRAIGDEVKLDSFYEQNKGAFKWVTEQLNERAVCNKHMRMAFYARVAKLKGMEVETIPGGARLQLGTLLLELLAETPLAEKRTYTVKGRAGKPLKVSELAMSDHLLKLMKQHNARFMELAVLNKPMIEEPEPWTSPTDGGYKLTAAPLIVQARPRQLEALKNAELGQVYEAVNALGRVPYKVDKDVLQAVRWAFDRDLSIGKMPHSVDREIPVRPEGMPKDSKEFQVWKEANKNAYINYAKTARDAYSFNHKNLGKKFAFQAVVEVADEMSQYERIYFPHQLDFRGRMYPMPIVFNPQGPDYVRGLLLFAEGKKLTTDQALGWHMIHGANCWGLDKEPFSERLQWVEDNHKRILELVADWKSNSWWTEADKPFQFLQWAFDYARVMNDEPSHIRVALDGTCNGLQHLSVMLRDREGADAVNLSVGDKPNDIYQSVANRVIERLREETDPKRKQWAQTFLHVYGIDRKVTKRSVMVMPYGGQMTSTLDYVREALIEKIPQSPLGDDFVNATGYLGEAVYLSTREVIRGGKLVMDWLQECTKVLNEAGEHVEWVTPHGFPMLQDYRKLDKERVKTMVHGKPKFSALRTPTDEINKQRSINSVSPNFVHSLDACHLALTVIDCFANDIKGIHVVHDDYGVHAEDTDRLFKIIRERFVDLYDCNDVLRQFKEQNEERTGVSLPEPPEAGDFDIQEVLDSEYFFS